MDLTPDQAANAVERHDCSKCEVPAGSACRTRSGKCATKYHTARFNLVPALREELAVPVPEDRGPGRLWKPGPSVETLSAAAAARPIRIGYARCSTAFRRHRPTVTRWLQAEQLPQWRDSSHPVWC